MKVSTLGIASLTVAVVLNLGNFIFFRVWSGLAMAIVCGACLICNLMYPWFVKKLEEKKCQVQG